MTPEIALITGVFSLLFLIAIGVPISLSLAIVGVGGISATKGIVGGLSELSYYPFACTNNYLLLVIPLFIIMGHLAAQSGVTKDAYTVASKLFSGFPAGLGIATTVGCAGFGAACGSSTATVAAMGRITVPEMERAGYDSDFACAIVASGSLLALMIPPSIPLVIYGVLSETSVGAMLVAGFIPGMMSTVVFSLGIFIIGLKNPKLAKSSLSLPLKERVLALSSGWRMLVLVVIVIGGMYTGIFTPTEASAAGAFSVLLMALVRPKGLKRGLLEAIQETVRTTCMIFLLTIGAGFFSHFMALAGVPAWLAKMAADSGIPSWALVILCLSIYLPLGMFLEGISMMMITLPLLLPIIVEQLGYSPIWFGIMVVKLIEIGLLTPPVGLNVYVMAAVAPHVSMERIFRAVGWFLLMELISLCIIFIFPSIATWLPSKMYM